MQNITKKTTKNLLSDNYIAVHYTFIYLKKNPMLISIS